LVALNASPAALFAEIRETLDHFDPNLAEDYLNTVPTDEDSMGSEGQK
jgi:hypothetical protein